MPPLLISAFCFLNFSFVFELVAEAGRERDAGFFEQIEHAIVKSRCFLPDGEFFELGIFGHVVFLLSIGSGRLLAIGNWQLAIANGSHAHAYTPLRLSLGSENANGPASSEQSRPIRGGQRYALNDCGAERFD